MKIKKFLPVVIPFAVVLLLPAIGVCSVDSSLQNIQLKLVNTLLPALGAIGICFAAFSFFTGNPNARMHLFMALLGAAVGFGSESLIKLIQSLVH